MKDLTFTIVINTLNRGPELQKVLESFRWLKYSGEFEVVVVNGPSTDDSDEVIADWLPKIRAGKCKVANLSISRNIGICMAQGDIIAFIDDDAIPEPEWLTQLANAYEDPMVGAVGGLVYNHTGYEFQYKYCTVDRFGNADLSQPGPTPHLSFPKSYNFPHLLGCNSSFRRTALLEVGGFDEEYEYFLDETDVCLRIVDAGYIIAQLSCAYVHHKFAPSNIRSENKVTRYRYPIIKNKLYFTLKHAQEFHSLERVLQEQETFIKGQINEVDWCVSQNLLSKDDQTTFNDDLKRAIEVGKKRGFEGVRDDAMIDRNKLEKFRGEFQAFRPIVNKKFKVVVFVSADFPPDHGGGVATFNKDLSEAVAAEGNLVHVITKSPDINRVDLENGVWVHRMVMREMERSLEAIENNVPQHIWDWSAIAHEEALRIASHHKIDIIEAPIWDCEGVAFLFDRQWPLITSLQTTLHFWLDSYPEMRGESDWMESFGSPILALEKQLMLRSNSIRSISAAIRYDIEKAYKFNFDDKRICIAPLGMPYDKESPASTKRRSEGYISVLFVGRLEVRKGIDILLSAIPLIFEEDIQIHFRILGDDTLLKPGEKVTFKDEYLTTKAAKQWSDRVKFEGRVSDGVLQEAYKSCDIFVAPSRFESFGLVYLEAMREAKPVIGCSVGGVPEVVSHEVNGLLVQADDVEGLVAAILRLAGSSSLRSKMGSAGRKEFLLKFTSERMANISHELYGMAEKSFREPSV